MNIIKQAINFASFFVRSTNQHGIHSPYLFNLYNHVIADDRKFYPFESLEWIRNDLLGNDKLIEIVDLGAGSTFDNKKKKKISDIAKQQISKPYQLRTLFRLVDWLQAKNIVELGTSLGLSSFYLAAAASDIKVDTFEGNPYFVQFVESQKKKYTIENVNIISGNFDTTFPSYLSDKPVIDLAFIDGNHRKEATIKYTEWTMDHLSENAVIVLDDIHWSKGMFEAWNSLKNHYRVTASIDMYTMGILFFNKDFKEKRHLEIRPKYFFT